MRETVTILIPCPLEPEPRSKRVELVHIIRHQVAGLVIRPPFATQARFQSVDVDCHDFIVP
jgi:hypothetical protein